MMRGDVAAGSIVLAIGVAVLVNAASFPDMPGQPIGPAFFPLLLAAGLVVSGLVLILAERIGRPADTLALNAGLRRPRMLANALVVVAALAVYALVVETVGFFITSSALLLVLFLAFGTRPRHAVPLAVVVPLVLHYAFYTVLRVPLPWGLLEGAAW